MVRHDAMHDRQAQTRAFVERTVKRLKNRVQSLRRNPAALILDRQQRRAGAILRGWSLPVYKD
jgi:hypothetical protein